MHSITQPQTQPNSLTSTQARSMRVFSQETGNLSVRPMVQPAPDQPSYSGSSTRSPCVRALGDDLDVAVAHAAGVALMPAVIEVLAQLRGLPLLHVHVAGQVGRVVLDRQHAELGEVHHPGQRAVVVERGRRGIGLQIVRDVVGGLDEPAGVVGGQRLGAAHDAHRLELLLAHHRAAAVLGRHVAVVAVDGGEAHQVLPRGTDARRPRADDRRGRARSRAPAASPRCPCRPGGPRRAPRPRRR